MYTVLVSNMEVNKQQSEITQIALDPLSVTPTLQEALNKMIPRMIKTENTMSPMQANVPEPNLLYFSTSLSFFKPCCFLSSRSYSKLFLFSTRPDFSASSIVTP